MGPNDENTMRLATRIQQLQGEIHEYENPPDEDGSGEKEEDKTAELEKKKLAGPVAAVVPPEDNLDEAESSGEQAVSEVSGPTEGQLKVAAITKKKLEEYHDAIRWSMKNVSALW